MLPQSLQDRINLQINREIYSEYLYLSMAAYCEAQGLSGFANFFKIQVQEEHFHAMRFFDFVHERGGRVVLDAIAQPKVDFNSALEVFELSYKHEQFITKSINELMDLAIKENDHATRSFLNWFVDEQVEEESNMDTIINHLRLIDGKGHGMLMLDRELAGRVFTPPTI